MTRSILILGATSPIARATSEEFAQKGYSIYLAGRNEEELKRIAADIQIRHHVKCRYGYFDAEDLENHESFFHQVVEECEEIEGVVLAFGYMGEQEKATRDCRELQAVINRNYTGACSILATCANYLELKKTGFLVAFSSVAGDRGRQSNYVYGSAKAGLSTYLQGLRNRLHPLGVQVLTVKPGFVDTSMTFGKSGTFLVADPKDIARDVVKAIDRKKTVIYTPWFWRWIMALIKAVPESIFQRLKL